MKGLFFSLTKKNILPLSQQKGRTIHASADSNNITEFFGQPTKEKFSQN